MTARWLADWSPARRTIAHEAVAIVVTVAGGRRRWRTAIITPASGLRFTVAVYIGNWFAALRTRGPAAGHAHAAKRCALDAQLAGVDIDSCINGNGRITAIERFPTCSHAHGQRQCDHATHLFIVSTIDDVCADSSLSQ